MPLLPSHQMAVWGLWCKDVDVMSASFRTDLNKVDGNVSIQHYLRNIIYPIIIPLHKQQRPEFILVDDNAPARWALVIIVLHCSQKVKDI